MAAEAQEGLGNYYILYIRVYVYDSVSFANFSHGLANVSAAAALFRIYIHFGK